MLTLTTAIGTTTGIPQQQRKSIKEMLVARPPQENRGRVRRLEKELERGLRLNE
jgi:hypothetical protein